MLLNGFVGGLGVNIVVLHTGFAIDPDPRLIRYPTIKDALMAIDVAFEPEWVSAAPSDLEEHFGDRKYDRPPMPPCWMIKLSPPIAALVTPPSAVIGERFPDGSLFMAATDDTFVTANPRHLEGARAIHAVVDPLNATIPFRTFIPFGDAAEI